MDLTKFGQSFRELRMKRGLTQGQIIQSSEAYADERSLRKVEDGASQPRRHTVIRLVVKGLGERDGSVVNQFLDLAGYEGLSERERVTHDIMEPPPPARELSVKPAIRPPHDAVAVSTVSTHYWKAAIVVFVSAGIVSSILLHGEFLIITSALYASLYAISVVLESTYDYRGVVTVMAAALSSSIVWVTSLAAVWCETTRPGLTGLWIALSFFLMGAMAQWLAVRPALSSHPIVPARFQPMTGGTAHLKNTGYYLILVFSFWAVPVHCVATHGASGTPRQPILCPSPTFLWLLLVGYFGASLYMAHFLLSRLRFGHGFDQYLTFFFLRAIIGFFLSVICLLWYSSALAG